MDPIGLEGGLNTYGYAYQNPIVNFDPDGQFIIALAHPGTWVALGKAAAFLGSAAMVAWAGNEIIIQHNDSVHPEEDELLDAGCEDASWAIPKLKALIASRKRQYKASGGGRIDINPTGPGHKTRIKNLEDKLKWLENCPKACP